MNFLNLKILSNLINDIFYKFSTHKNLTLNLLFLFSLFKSIFFLSPFFPPTSITILTIISLLIKDTNLIIIWFVITAGSTIGSIISYHIGYIVIKKNIFNKFLKNHKNIISFINKKLKTHQILILFTSKFFTILRYLVPLISGILKINKIIAYTMFFLSSATWSIILIFIYEKTIKLFYR